MTPFNFFNISNSCRFQISKTYLIVDSISQEGNELGLGALHAQRQRDGGQLFDGVQPELDILVSELVNKDSDGVEGVVRCVTGHFVQLIGIVLYMI